MRITDITLNANESEIAIFNLNDPLSDEVYIAKAIIGLDADEIVSKFYGFGSNSKRKFYDLSIKERQIVMRIVLNPRRAINETYSDLRDDLYRAISASRTGMVDIYMFSGATLVAQLSGAVTKFEVPHFSKVAEAQITIMCENPLMRAVNPVILEPQNISTTNPVIVADSLSTAPHGFKFQIKFTAPTTSFTIQDTATSPDWTFTIIPGLLGATTGFIVDDILDFSSEFNNKRLTLTRGPNVYSLIDKLQLGSMWPIVFPGQNEFHIFSGTFVWNYIEFYAAYWGV